LGGLLKTAYDNSALFRDVVNTLKDDLAKFWNDVLVPVGNYLRDVWINDVWPKLQELWVTLSRDVLPKLQMAVEALWKDALKPMLDFIIANPDVFKALAIGAAILAGLFIAAGAAAAFLGAILVGVLVGASLLATAVLGGIIVVVWKLIQVWWDLFNTVRDAVGGIWSFVYEKLGPDGLLGFIAGMPGRISSAAAGMFDGIKEAFRSAINWVVDRWNSLSFSLPNIPGTDIGGFTLSTPDIPRLAGGGIVTSPMLALIGESGSEAVIPLDRLQGNTYNITIQTTGLGADSPEIARQVVGLIRTYERANGAI
jgi:hypothetical protein